MDVWAQDMFDLFSDLHRCFKNNNIINLDTSKKSKKIEQEEEEVSEEEVVEKKTKKEFPI